MCHRLILALKTTQLWRVCEGKTNYVHVCTFEKAASTEPRVSYSLSQTRFSLHIMNFILATQSSITLVLQECLH